MSDNKFTLEDILAEYDKKIPADTHISDKPKPAPAPKPVQAAAQKPAPAAKPVQTAVPKAAPAPKPVQASAPKAAVQSEPIKKSPAENKENAAAVKKDTPQSGAPAGEKKRIHNSGIRVQSNSPIKLRIEQYSFLFKQLVKRDFKGRYKRAALGVLWSMLSPMFSFAAQAIIFSVLFKRGEHYISYLIVGNVVFHYFTDSANAGMFSMAGNGGILSKINVPKSIFLLSKNVSCLINFLLTMVIMFIITTIDGIAITPMCATIIIPMTLMTIFNLGLGYALSSWFVFFKDTQYLFSIFTQVLMYFSAIFYRITAFPENVQKLFYLNPVYCYITYFRMVIIDGVFPSLKLNIACVFYAVIMLLLGLAVYKKSNNKFVFYF